MSRRFWTDTELNQLRALYPNHSAVECAAALGRSDRSVIDQVKRLGLRKSPEWIAQRSREASRQKDHGGRAHQFKPGHKTWNKGMKGLQIGGEHSRFPPGQRPHTWKPVGHEVVRDGVPWRKVSDEHRGDNSRFNYRSVPVLVWEAAHGPVPEGHLVRFREGMATTDAAAVTLDRLELITRAQNMARNTIHNYPMPIKSLIRAVGRAQRALENRSE